MGYDRDCHVCVYLSRIVCVWRVCRSHSHQCTRAKTVIPYVHIIGVHDFLHGYFYAHYCTHKRRYGGVGFRNESFPQLRKLPQLFHPHTYVTPTPYLPPTYQPPTHTPLKPRNTNVYSLPKPLYLPTLTTPYNPPIGGHGFRISTFSTSIMGTYRIPSRTDPRTPLNFRLLFLVFISLP